MSEGILKSSSAVEAENARFMAGVYRWMTIGVFVTSLLSYLFSNNYQLMGAVLTNKFLFYGILIAEFGLVIAISSMINKISAMTATILFLIYSALNGVTFSVILMAYTQESIFSAFMTTAIAFAGLSGFGYVTKKDLGPVGTFCTMGLWGLIGFGLLSFFFPSLMGGANAWIFNIVGLIVFCGLTAYDTQKIKESNIIGNEGSEEDHKETILGALKLYLDFINLFLFILRLIGGKRR